jgi:DNA-binding NarL/FixJ family response regulator
MLTRKRCYSEHEVRVVELLSDRECEVIRLCAWGANEADIATELFITRNTVKTHLRRIRSKLCAANSAHAVCIAIRRGYLSLDDVVACESWTPPMVRED